MHRLECSTEVEPFETSLSNCPQLCYGLDGSLPENDEQITESTLELPRTIPTSSSTYSFYRRCYSFLVDASRRTHKHSSIPDIVSGTASSNSSLLGFRHGEWIHRSSSRLLRRTPRCCLFRKANLQWCNPGTDSWIPLLHNSLGLRLGHLEAFPRLPKVQVIRTPNLLL